MLTEMKRTLNDCSLVPVSASNVTLLTSNLSDLLALKSSDGFVEAVIFLGTYLHGRKQTNCLTMVF